MGLLAFSYFILGPIVGYICYFIWSSFREPTEQERSAGRIHLFHGDRYYDSAEDNPYQCHALNWADGKIGSVLSDELARVPEYQPALIGTIQILKPKEQAGRVAVILDNERVAALGLHPVGLPYQAQLVADAAIPEATLKTN